MTYNVTLYYSFDDDTVAKEVLTVSAPDQETACLQASDTMRARPGVKHVMVEDSAPA